MDRTSSRGSFGLMPPSTSSTGTRVPIFTYATWVDPSGAARASSSTAARSGFPSKSGSTFQRLELTKPVATTLAARRPAELDEANR